MSEVSTYIRLGIVFVILSSIIVTMFALFGIANAAKQDYYEGQSELIHNTEAELVDLYNARLPMVQLLDKIDKSEYSIDLQQLVIHTAQRTDGKLTGVNTKTYTDIDSCWNDWDGRIGYLEQIERMPNGAYIISIRVGG